MLIISRKKDEKIIVSEDIEITILEVGRNRVRFGIKAPKSVSIQTRMKQTSDSNDDIAGKLEVVEMPSSEISERAIPAAAGFSRGS